MEERNLKKIYQLKKKRRIREDAASEAEKLRLLQYEETLSEMAKRQLPVYIATGSAEMAWYGCLENIREVAVDDRERKSVYCELANTLPPGTQVRVFGQTASVEEVLREILAQPFYRALMEQHEKYKRENKL
jgi:anion-transporting  ArsA/GET3 family ATPase